MRNSRGQANQISALERKGVGRYELEQKAKVLETNSQNNQEVITALLENGKNKDLQISSSVSAF